MKKLSLLFLSFLTITIFFTGCKDSATTATTETLQGSLVKSTPSGAQIWVDGVNSGDVTPHLMDSLTVGIHTISLKFSDYDDLSFADTVALSTIDTIKKALTSSLFTQHGPITLYVYPGTKASGLNLATGNVYTVDAANASYIDFYYSSEADTAMNYFYAAQKNSVLSRTTYLFPSLQTQLLNGADASVYSTSDLGWGTSFAMYGATVFYVYDKEKHYSKVLLTGQGTGFIELQWLYNKTVDDLRF